MNANQTERLIRRMWHLAEVERFYFPLCLWGEAGVGKSETVKAVADQLNEEYKQIHHVRTVPENEKVNVQILMLGQLDVGDLIGTPRSQEVYPDPFEARQSKGYSTLYTRTDLVSKYTKDEEKIRHPELKKLPKELIWKEGLLEIIERECPLLVTNEVTYSTPSWWPTVWSRPKGILFLDEVNRGTKDVRSACFQLLLDRKIHTRELPEGWILVAAANPEQSDSAEIGGSGGPERRYEGVEMTNDAAWLNRFIHIGFKPTLEEWLVYATRNQIDPHTRQPRKKGEENVKIVNPTICHYMQKNRDKNILGLQECWVPTAITTPRAWTVFSRVIGTNQDPIDPDLIDEIGKGIIGSAHASAFKALLDRPELPLTGSEVIDSYLTDFRKEPVLDAAGNHVESVLVRNNVDMTIRYPVRSEQAERLKLYLLAKRVDLIRMTDDNILGELKHRMEISGGPNISILDERQCENILQYLIDVGEFLMEKTTGMVKDLCSMKDADGNSDPAQMVKLTETIYSDHTLASIVMKSVKSKN